MYGMKKTTVYLPDELKAALERAAAAQGRSEAERGGACSGGGAGFDAKARAPEADVAAILQWGSHARGEGGR